MRRRARDGPFKRASDSGEGAGGDRVRRSPPRLTDPSRTDLARASPHDPHPSAMLAGESPTPSRYLQIPVCRCSTLTNVGEWGSILLRGPQKARL